MDAHSSSEQGVDERRGAGAPEQDEQAEQQHGQRHGNQPPLLVLFEEHQEFERTAAAAHASLADEVVRIVLCHDGSASQPAPRAGIDALSSAGPSHANTDENNRLSAAAAWPRPNTTLP